MASKLVVGEAVRYFQLWELPGRRCGGQWVFGKVIGVHFDNVGVNPSGLECATVRFKTWRRENGVCCVSDVHLPQFQLERCGAAGLEDLPIGYHATEANAASGQ